MDYSPLYLSIKVAVLSVLLLLAPGVLLGYVLARKQFVGKGLLNALVHIPLVLPPVVTGYLLLTLLGKNGWLGQWLANCFGVQLNLAFSFCGAVIASAIVALPLLVRSVRIAMEQIDPRLEQAARTLGASPLTVFIKVTIRLSFAGIISGMVLAFARSLGEFGATILFAGNIKGVTQTLPLAIYTAMQQANGDNTVLCYVLVSIGLSFCAIMVSELVIRRLQHQAGKL